MKVAVVSGSYRDKGVTATLKQSFINGLQSIDTNAQVDDYNLRQANVDYCHGCMSCIKSKNSRIGDCSIDDDAKKIMEKCLDADLVVLASPIYEGYITAIMKKFNERTLPLSKIDSGRPSPRNKKVEGKIGVVLLSSGVPYPLNIVVGIVKNAKKAMFQMQKVFGTDKVFSVIAGNVFKNEITKEKYKNQSFNLGVKVGKLLSKKSL